MLCTAIANAQVQEQISFTQSVFVHTDKENYYPGDTIFFKSYIFDSQNKLVSGKYNLYVDLLYPSGILRKKGLLMHNNGTAAGQFIIPDTVSGGIYILRAYTHILKHAGDPYFFYKPINIINENKYYYEKELFKKTKKYNKSTQSFVLIPEGGKLLLNVNNKIFVSPENGIISDSISVKIYKNNVLNEKKTGENLYFFAKPQKDDKYKVIIEHNGKKHQLKFPEYSVNSTKITYSKKEKGKYIFAVRHNKLLTKDTVSATYSYTALLGTKKILSGKITALHDSSTIEIETDSLPKGIINMQLRDFNNRFVSEVFFFNNKKEQYPELKLNYTEKNVSVLTNFENKSNLSVSVVCLYDTNFISNFYNSIVLNNEMKSAQSIFGKNELKQKQINAKKLSLEILYFDSINKISYIKKPEELKNDSGISFTGKLTTQLLNIPIKNKEVLLFVMNKYNDIYRVKTNEKGEYEFKGLVYFDSLELSIESFKSEEKHGYYLTLNEPETVISNVFTINKIENLKKGRRTVNKNYNYLPKKNNTHSLHGTPDQIIDFDQINASSYNNALQVIDYYVPGISENNNSSLRGNSNFSNNGEPLYLINDMPTSKDVIRSLPAEDIDRVEIIKSISKSAIYGSRGTNGIIAVYTKSGKYASIGKIRVVTEGFQSEKIRKAKFEKIPKGKETSIYWNPNIKTDSAGNLRFNFSLPSGKYFYRIIIQGVDEKGKLIYVNKLFEH